MIHTQVILCLIALATTFGGTACAHHTSSSDDVIVISDRSSRSSWIGVSIRNMSPELARSMRIDVMEGALVNEVIKDSPADSAGIREEDVIIEFDGRRIENANDLVRAVRRTDPGRNVTMVVMRDDKATTLQLVVGQSSARKRIGSYSFRHPVAPRIHIFTEGLVYGMKLEELNEQLAEYFDVPGRKAILVKKVEKRSAAEKAGIKAGDVLLKIGKETVEDLQDIRAGLSDYKDGERIAVEILRKGKRETLTLEADRRELRGEYFFEPFGGYHKEFYHLPDGEWEFFFEDRDRLKRELNDLKLELKQIPRKLKDEMERFKLELEKARDKIMREYRST